MCWSLRASLCFTLLGGLMTVDQIRRTLSIHPKEWRARSISQVLMYLAYTLMEFLQFLQYWYGLEGTCGTTSNLTLSVVAHFLIWTQPIVHNYWCLNNTAKGRSTFRFALACSCLTLLVATISLVMGYFQVGGFGTGIENEGPEGTPGYLLGIEVQNVNSKLCSMQGPNHLYWMFPYHPIWGHGISWYTWLICAALPHFFRYSVKDNDFFGKSWVMGSAVVGGWLVALGVTLTIGKFHETPSYWCLISVPCLVLPYLAAFARPKRFLVREHLYVKNAKKVD